MGIWSIVDRPTSVELCARKPACEQRSAQPCEQRIGSGRGSWWLLCGPGLANEPAQPSCVQMFFIAIACRLSIYISKIHNILHD
jgi:hypothetical protein